MNIENFANKIFALLKGNGLKIKIFDSEGAETTDPTAGRRFFVLSPNIMVTLDEENGKVEFSKGSKADDLVLKVQKNIRKLADEFLMNFDIKVFGRTIKPRDYAYQAKMQKDTSVMEDTSVKPINHHMVGQIMNMIRVWGGKISEPDLTSNLGIFDLSEIRPVLNRLVKEGKLVVSLDKSGVPVYSKSVEETVMESFSKMFGSLKTSQQTLENVRILVKHKAPIDENIRGSRSRHIQAIFLESNGERFRFPHNYLPGARAMAQHMAHGGTMFDKVGSYVLESTGQLLKLQSFNRYIVTNKLINESSNDIVETLKENIDILRLELKKITGSKTYESIKARLETFERQPVLEDDISSLRDIFTIRKFDEQFNEVLPIINQLVQEKNTYHKRIEEAAANVVLVKNDIINSTPMFEFSSENARLGFKLNELALRIVENDELAGFVNKIGTKLCKEGIVNDFEKAIVSSVFENMKVFEYKKVQKELKESIEFDTFFNKFMINFM